MLKEMLSTAQRASTEARPPKWMERLATSRRGRVSIWLLGTGYRVQGIGCSVRPAAFRWRRASNLVDEMTVMVSMVLKARGLGAAFVLLGAWALAVAGGSCSLDGRLTTR